MSDGDGGAVATRHAELDNIAEQIGSTLHAPFYDAVIYGVIGDPRFKVKRLGLI